MLNLRVSTRIEVTEPEIERDFITHYEITIKNNTDEPDDFSIAGLPDGNEESDTGECQAHVGKAFVSRLHIELCANQEEDLFEICDSIDSFWHSLYSTFFTNEPGFYQDKAGLEDCCSHDVIVIHDISLIPDYQNRGVEMAVAQRIMDTLGAGCCLAVYYYGDKLEELQRFTPMGFKNCDMGDMCFLNLLHLSPRVEELREPKTLNGLCRFQAVSKDADGKDGG